MFSPSFTFQSKKAESEPGNSDADKGKQSTTDHVSHDPEIGAPKQSVSCNNNNSTVWPQQLYHYWIVYKYIKKFYCFIPNNYGELKWNCFQVDYAIFQK